MLPAAKKAAAETAPAIALSMFPPLIPPDANPLATAAVALPNPVITVPVSVAPASVANPVLDPISSA